MGGVNSVRLMPDTEIQVTQQVDGSLRKTVVALQRGTVFNRVGHHDGEKQSYQVETPQGVSVAKGTEFADSLTNGHHYVFVVKGIVATIMNGIQTGTLIALPNNVASGAMPPADGRQQYSLRHPDAPAALPAPSADGDRRYQQRHRDPRGDRLLQLAQEHVHRSGRRRLRSRPTRIRSSARSLRRPASGIRPTAISSGLRISPRRTRTTSSTAWSCRATRLITVPFTTPAADPGATPVTPPLT